MKPSLNYYAKMLSRPIHRNRPRISVPCGIAFVATLLLFASCSAQSTTNLVELKTNDPDLHLLNEIAPVYPPIAKAAHVSGIVEMEVEIGADGKVVSTKPVSGPPMLVGAAQEAVQQWTYAPVLRDGAPVRVSTTVSIHFDLPAPKNPHDEKIAATFFPLQDACLKAFSAKADAAQTAEACGKAADVASTFSPEERFIERRSAYVYASTAYLRNRQAVPALDFANKAIGVVDQGHDDGSGSSAAYSVRAQAEAATGDLASASDDLAKAEDFERLGIKQLGGPDDPFVKHQYIPVLRNLLNFHAQVLRAEGKASEAEAKEEAASSL